MEDYIQRNRANVQAKKASAYSQELAKRTAKPEKLAMCWRVSWRGLKRASVRNERGDGIPRHQA